MINLPLQSTPTKPGLQSHSPWALQVPSLLQSAAGSQGTAKIEMGNFIQLL